jgi:hypothetical protein
MRLANMDAQPCIFFAGRYSYRKPGAFVAGVLAALGGGYVLRYLVLSIPHTTWSIKAYGAAAFVGGIGGLLFVCGLIVLRRWFAQTSLTLEISAAGVRYGETFHSWSEIHWISGHTDRKGVQLFYQTRQRGLAGCDRPLPVDSNPTVEEFHSLLETLRGALSEKYPNVEFG